jgi:hypothetical protein
MIAPTVSCFPDCPSVSNDAGVPLGCVVQPLAELNRDSLSDDAAEDVGRCASCGAYMNPFCGLLRHDWRCSLCGGLTPLGDRYSSVQPGRRDRLQELREDVVEFEFAGDVDDGINTPPVFIAIVDACGGDDFLEVVRAALHAAQAALPADALFGLVVVSDTVGVYLLSAASPHVRHIPIPPEGESLSIDEAIGLERMLVPVRSYSKGIALAIETIGRSTDASTRSTSCFGLGAALRSLVDTLSAAPWLAPARLLLIIGRRPNYAAGALPALSGPDRVDVDDAAAGEGDSGEDDHEGTSPTSMAFYDALAHDTASVGAAVFLYAVSRKPLGLDALQALVSCTGGVLNLYTDANNCTVPEDVFKQVSRPFASQGMLRLRTSPELIVSQAYGPIVLDETVEQLFHLPGCYDDMTVAFSLGFNSSSGFGEEHETLPTIQVAYSYSMLVPVDAEKRIKEELPVRWTRVRRLRVQTIQIELARTTRQIYESIDERVLMLLVTQKVIVSIEKDGLRDARLRLQDWLVFLLAKYQLNYEAHPDTVLYPEQMCPAVASIPRLVYGLLRGPLLSSHTPLSTHRLTSDGLTELRVLFRCLPVAELSNAIHPTLLAFTATGDATDGRGLPLSWDALQGSRCCLFLMDACTHVYIYLSEQGGSEVVFPPNKSSAIVRAATALKQERFHVTSIVYCKAGTAASTAFERYLDGTEEEDIAASRSDICREQGDRFTYSQFLLFLHAQTKQRT